MSLVSITEMLADARKNRYAVGAFNTLNLEMVHAIVRAAESEATPVIVQVWHGDLELLGGRYIGAIARIAAESASVPIALQLDHGQTEEQVRSCIDWGFTSVMIDLSSSSFEDNLNQTREIVKLAHARGVSVEAELGRIFSGEYTVERQKSSLTDLDLAGKFALETRVDALAVSVGTAHGAYSYGPDIDFDLLRRIIEKADVPIVVHGGSFTAPNDIIRMIELGVAKINIGTELMLAFVNGVRDKLSEQNSTSARQALVYARDRVRNLVQEKIRLLNTLRTGRG
jgi:ketose-bisphosphate aldolase